jgi:hypothetical protein
VTFLNVERAERQPDGNRTVGAPPRLLCYLGFKIAPASENTQGSGGSKFLLASAQKIGRTEAHCRRTDPGS